MHNIKFSLIKTNNILAIYKLFLKPYIIFDKVWFAVFATDICDREYSRHLYPRV